jgi:phospholipid/cholesterol/gamma-HCH transport system ATP-binding protein
VAVLADRRVVIAAPVPEVLAFQHPFIQQFFLGERGRRAMSQLQQRHEQNAVAANGR